MKTNKDFDAVEMMRSIRKKLHDDYIADPSKRIQRLEEIRKRYRSKIKKQETASR